MMQIRESLDPKGLDGAPQNQKQLQNLEIGSVVMSHTQYSTTPCYIHRTVPLSKGIWGLLEPDPKSHM